MFSFQRFVFFLLFALCTVVQLKVQDRGAVEEHRGNIYNMRFGGMKALRVLVHSHVDFNQTAVAG